MSDTPDFRDLVGDDLTPEEELELARVDSLLRSVPGPATEVPGSLTHAVERIGTARPIWTRRRVFVAVALAATLAALFFGVGRWLDRGFDARASVQMTPGTSAPNASAKIELGPRDDATGNWRMRIVVDGPPSPRAATTTTSSGSRRTASTRAPAGPSTSAAARPST